MAERRMMSKKIIDTDKFLDMPQSTQNLYFHLLLRADDDGFIQSPKSVMRITGCKDDDLKLLIAKEFLIRFDTGVIVIKHWRIHNYLRVDRYNKSELPEVKQVQLVDKVYELTGGTTIGTTIGIPAVTEMDTQIRIDKNRLEENREEDIYSPAKQDNTPKEVYEIIDYLNLKTGKSYKHTTKKTKSLIKARLNEHFTVDDFKKVIDNMCAKWIGTKWEEFLRPNTLFAGKFDDYLNQTPTKSETRERIDNVNALLKQYEEEERRTNEQG
jgi:hypothetical protein